MRTFTRVANMSPGLRDTGDEIEAEHINELQQAAEDFQTGALPIALAGIEGALGGYEPLQNMRAGVYNAADYPGGNTDAIMAAIADARDNSEDGQRGGIIDIPDGDWVIEESIPRYPWMTIRGRGGANPGDGGTRLVAHSSLDGDVIASSSLLGLDGEFQHGGGVFDLQVLGNNQQSGAGIHLADTGELCAIDRVMVYGCSGHGIHIEGASTPTYIGYVSVHGNGRDGGSGIFLDRNVVTSTYIGYLAGDNNGDALLEIDALSMASVHVASFKAERWGANYGHPDVFRVHNGNSSPLIVGVGRLNLAGGVPDGNAIFRLTHDDGSTDANIVVYGGIEYNTLYGPKYTYDVQSQQTGDEIPWNTYRGRPFTHGYKPPAHLVRSGGEPVRYMSRAGVTQPVVAARNIGDTVDRFSVGVRGLMQWGPGDGAVDTNLYRSSTNTLKTDDAFELPGTYDLPLRLGAYRLWVNPGDGKLYIKGTAPSSATDGTVVGTQS